MNHEAWNAFWRSVERQLARPGEAIPTPRAPVTLIGGPLDGLEIESPSVPVVEIPSIARPFGPVTCFRYGYDKRAGEWRYLSARLIG